MTGEMRRSGEAALALMDEHLASRLYLVGNRLSLADIALYAYTHVAGEGGLAGYPAFERTAVELDKRIRWLIPALEPAETGAA